MTSDNSFLRLQARTQRFTLGNPKEFRVARDGSYVLFLRARSGEDRSHLLWRLDLATGEESVLADPGTLLEGGEQLSAEERARRERTREQGGGVVGNATDDQARTVAFALSGRLFVADAVDGTVRELATATPVGDPRPDPTGAHVAYLANRELRVVGVSGEGDRALAAPETEDQACGAAEFVAAEEMGRTRGYWWSPDGSRLLVAFTDNADVQRWHIADPANPAQQANTVSYPSAGTQNTVVRLRVLGLDGGSVDVDWDGVELPYLVTAHWSAGGPALIALQSRDQRTVQIRSVEPATGATELVHEETDERWVDIFSGVPAWTPDGRLVRITARDGANRLVVGEHEVSGSLQVRAVLGAGERVLFTASAEDPTQVHVYRTGPDGPVRLSTVDGVFTAAGTGAVTVLAGLTLRSTRAQVSVLRDEQPVAAISSLAVEAPIDCSPIMLTLGEHGLRAALLYPSGHVPGSRSLPVLLDPYGGPHGQRVLSARGAYGMSQWLADQGFAVLVIDGRGTPGHGPDWDRAIHHDFAGVTLADQIDGLHAAAKEHPDLDLSTVAIRGWSYGGYLAALAVLRAPDVFHAGIAGAPVTDWTLYDTHYTERYLGMPDEQPEVYRRNSLLEDAPSLERPLLIIHGLADDNVVVAHSLRLSSALTGAGRPHALIPLPGVTHMTTQPDEAAENFLLLQVRWLRSVLGLEGGR